MRPTRWVILPAVALVLVLLALSWPAAQAGPPGRGKGHGGSQGRHPGGVVGLPPGHGGIPPGHGGLPPGLAKKLQRSGSLPPGWAKKFSSPEYGGSTPYPGYGGYNASSDYGRGSTPYGPQIPYRPYGYDTAPNQYGGQGHGYGTYPEPVAPYSASPVPEPY